MELNKILIGLVLTSVFAITFIVFLTDGILYYNPDSIPSDYEDSFKIINGSLNSISDYTNETEQSLNTLGSSNSNVVSDFLGFFFGAGYKAVQIFIQGMKISTGVSEEGIKNTLGTSILGNTWIVAIGTIIMIILISILLHFIIKSERL